MQLRRRLFPSTGALALALCLAGAGWSHEKKSGNTDTVTGRVVDTACYFGHGSLGADHAQCATACAKKGIPLAILDTATNTLYLPLAADHHESANTALLAFVEKRIKITGTITEKNGMKAIVIENIEPAD